MSAPAPNWTVADAKARFSEVIEKAHEEGPQTITKNGRPTAVMVSIEEWEKKSHRSDSLAEFLLASPLRNSELDVDRAPDAPRELDL